MKKNGLERGLANVFLTGMIATLFFYGCKKNNDLPYFNGDIIIVNRPEKADCLQGEKILLDDIHTGSIDVYDSLLIFNSIQFPDQFLSVFNLHTKKQIASLCNKGHGPNEFQGVSVYDFVIDNNQLKLWLYAFNEQKMLLLNITESINSQTTQYDSIFILDWRKKFISPFNWIFNMDNQKVLAKCPSNVVFYDQDPYSASNYYLFDPFTNDTIRSYIIYNRPIVNELSSDPLAFLSSSDRIKPDKSKVAMGMRMVSQINILDLESGKLLGFRHRNTPDYSFLEKDPFNFRVYYHQICVDDDYIYGLYLNNNLTDIEINLDFATSEIHIFDWEGNFVKRVILDQKMDQIAVDLKNRTLYGYNTVEEELYAYEVGEIIK